MLTHTTTDENALVGAQATHSHVPAPLPRQGILEVVLYEGTTKEPGSLSEPGSPR
jgi:hypothetical protein